MPPKEVLMSKPGPDYLDALDAFLEGEDEGARPIDILERRGVRVRRATAVDDASLHDELWKVIRALAGVGLFLESTDHLSDRELYVHIEKEVLPRPTLLLPDDMSYACHHDIIGSFGPEELEIYYTFYADDEDRARHERELGPVAAKKARPYDRDRHLPKAQERQFVAGDESWS